MRKWRNWQTR